MKDILKSSIKHRKPRTYGSVYNRRKSGRSQNDYFSRIFMQACICLILTVFVFAVARFGDNSTSGLKNSLKNAIGNSVTAEDMEAFRVFLKNGISRIKNTDIPSFYNEEENETEKNDNTQKAVIRVEKNDYWAPAGVIVENTSVCEEELPG